MNDLQKIKELLQSMIPGAPVPEDVWETRDGRRIHIVDMTDKHLVNTLLYIKRQVTAEIKKRGWHIIDPTLLPRWRGFLPKHLKAKFTLMESAAIKRGFTDWESKHPIRE
jgi:hypothetical protein